MDELCLVRSIHLRRITQKFIQTLASMNEISLAKHHHEVGKLFYGEKTFVN